MTFPLVLIFAVVFTKADVALPTRSPMRLGAMTFPLVLIFAVALTKEVVALPTRSPMRLGAMTFPPVLILAVALTYVALIFPTASQNSSGGGITVEMTPVRKTPFPSKSVAYALPVVVIPPDEFTKVAVMFPT